MTGFIRIVIVLVAISAVTVGTPLPVVAVTIDFTESGDAAHAKVTGADAPELPCATSPSTECVRVSFTVDDATLATTTGVMAFILEPTGRQISDVVTLIVAAAGGTRRTVTAEFRSDPETGRTLPDSIVVFDREDGSAHTLSGGPTDSKFLTTTGTRYAFPGTLVITAMSEAAEGQPMPEPSELLLLNIGLVAIVLARTIPALSSRRKY